MSKTASPPKRQQQSSQQQHQQRILSFEEENVLLREAVIYMRDMNFVASRYFRDMSVAECTERAYQLKENILESYARERTAYCSVARDDLHLKMKIEIVRRVGHDLLDWATVAHNVHFFFHATHDMFHPAGEDPVRLKLSHKSIRNTFYGMIMGPMCSHDILLHHIVLTMAKMSYFRPADVGSVQKELLRANLTVLLEICSMFCLTDPQGMQTIARIDQILDQNTCTTPHALYKHVVHEFNGYAMAKLNTVASIMPFVSRSDMSQMIMSPMDPLMHDADENMLLCRDGERSIISEHDNDDNHDDSDDSGSCDTECSCPMCGSSTHATTLHMAEEGHVAACPSLFENIQDHRDYMLRLSGIDPLY